MTSLRQIEANRQNALQSTGPKTENGKQQSRRNALRHGFTAETVIEPLECPEEYRAFEEAIVSEYMPRSHLEQDVLGGPQHARELVASDTGAGAVSTSRAIAVSFLRLANLDNEIVDRLSRYEAALWRQLAQTLFTLQAIRRR